MVLYKTLAISLFSLEMSWGSKFVGRDYAKMRSRKNRSSERSFSSRQGAVKALIIFSCGVPPLSLLQPPSPPLEPLPPRALPSLPSLELPLHRCARRSPPPLPPLVGARPPDAPIARAQAALRAAIRALRDARCCGRTLLVFALASRRCLL